MPFYSLTLFTSIIGSFNNYYYTQAMHSNMEAQCIEEKGSRSFMSHTHMHEMIFMVMILILPFRIRSLLIRCLSCPWTMREYTVRYLMCLACILMRLVNISFSLLHSAIDWMVKLNFRNGLEMDSSNTEMDEIRYQHRGEAIVSSLTFYFV